MKIGLLSDTHGSLHRTILALRVLLQQQPAVIIHCGDIGSEEVLVELIAACEPARIPIHAVLGNVDWYETVLGWFYFIRTMRPFLSCPVVFIR